MRSCVFPFSGITGLFLWITPAQIFRRPRFPRVQRPSVFRRAGKARLWILWKTAFPAGFFDKNLIFFQKYEKIKQAPVFPDRHIPDAPPASRTAQGSACAVIPFFPRESPFSSRKKAGPAVFRSGYPRFPHAYYYY